MQHLQYLPFGEPFVDQHPAGYQERFRFTGKERDEETGYGYFGARYMDHELTAMWLSVDPMADKYPSISPYAYCAWNPIKLVDPDGRDWYKTDNGSIKYTTKYESAMGRYLGKTYNDGTTYYSLFGDKISNKIKNKKGSYETNPQKEITMKIDDAFIKYAKCCIAASRGEDSPSHPYTDFTISSIGFNTGFASINDYDPKVMKTYAGDMADIYYFVNGNKDFMEARFESWSPSTCVSGGNGSISTPVTKDKTGRYQRTYLTFRNKNSTTGVVAALNFRTEASLKKFKTQYCELFPGLKL